MAAVTPGVMLIIGSMESIFTKIYHQNGWHGSESRSGTGADSLQTAEICTQLPGLLKKYNIRSLLDGPCGDLNWMRRILQELDLDTYIGLDIVDEIIIENTTTFGSSKVKFAKGDLTRSQLPKVDMILCRDCLVHFTFEDILRALENMKNSGSRYLLMTNFPNTKTNVDIPTGCWRPLNFQLWPFHFAPPEDVIIEKCNEDDGIYHDKSLSLWSFSKLKIDHEQYYEAIISSLREERLRKDALLAEANNKLRRITSNPIMKTMIGLYRATKRLSSAH